MSPKLLVIFALATLALGACTDRSSSAGSLAPLVEPYLRIQSELASDRLDDVEEQAVALEQAAAARGAGARSIAAAARTLGQARTLAAAREAFRHVSTAIVAYADAADASLGQDVAVFYCSMAKQSWLQKGTAPKNPYYGASMLACGELRKRS